MAAQLPSNEEFPYSLQELEAAKTLLYDQIDFLSYFPSAEPINSGSYTHVAKCPFHKKGGELTPSFYFSVENDRRWVCWPCNARGDCFDFLEANTGTPWFFLVRDLLNGQGLRSLKLDFTGPTYDRDLPYRIDLELSRQLRDYLASVKTSPNYPDHLAWAESQFRRLDLRLKKLSHFKPQDLLAFRMQIQLEIKRRL